LIDGTNLPETILVLGAGSAIAQATTTRLVERGTTEVLLAARRPYELEEWAAEMRVSHLAATIRTLEFNAVDLESHRAVVDKAWGIARRVDLVLLAVGVMGDPDVYDAHDDAVAVSMTNYLGSVSILTPIVERLTAQGQGRIVVLSSAAAFLPRADQTAYASSKAGLDSFAQGLGHRLHGTGVEVVIVRPGFVHSPMTVGRPSAPFATTPDAVALDIVRGLETGAHTVWSPAVVRYMTGVARHLPTYAYRHLIANR
jgi:decaprenylphospho-beta-D-erythro-pentofuranosid-2-ulose 2-reductase